MTVLNPDLLCYYSHICYCYKHLLENQLPPTLLLSRLWQSVVTKLPAAYIALPDKYPFFVDIRLQTFKVLVRTDMSIELKFSTSNYTVCGARL